MVIPELVVHIKLDIYGYFSFIPFIITITGSMNLLVDY
jgi:hypothetical protein